jgi:hypothetical protein
MQTVVSPVLTEWEGVPVMRKALQVAMELDAAHDRVAVFEVRDDVVVAKMRDPADVLELAWRLGISRTGRDGQATGSVNGTRVVVEVAAGHDGSVWAPAQAPVPLVWPSTGVLSLDQVDEDTHDCKRRRRA